MAGARRVRDDEPMNEESVSPADDATDDAPREAAPPEDTTSVPGPADSHDTAGTTGIPGTTGFPGATDPPGAADSAAPVRRLTRSQEGRLITGVCAGLARYTRIDVVVFRVAFALLVITTGVGILVYLAAFLLMGAPDGGPSKVERAGKRVFDGDTALTLLGATLAAGMLFGVIGNWGSGDALSGVVVFGLVLLVARSRGVDLVQVARGLPDQVKGRPLSSWTPAPPAAAGYQPSDTMIDLARLGHRTAPYTLEPQDTIATATRPPFPAATPRRPRSYLSGLTLLAALLAAVVLNAFVGHWPMFARLQVVIGGALSVVAVGTLLAAWFGRDRKLVFVGALMSFALASTSIAGNAAVARSTHHQMWRPAAIAQADQHHRVLIGHGLVDLTSVPLSPGESLHVSAQVILGVLAVKVPSTARIEVDGHAYLGDITIDHRVTSGPGASVHSVLDPEGPPTQSPPTIVLHIRSKVGDMEVTRVPA